jgi:hypothetical protein
MGIWDILWLFGKFRVHLVHLFPVLVSCTKKNLAYLVQGPGGNPTIAIYNATGSLACFENKNILFYFEKRCCLLQRWSCSRQFKSRRIGFRGRFGRRVIRLSSGDTLESVRCLHAFRKTTKAWLFLKSKIFLLSLKRPSFYSFCEEEEECYQSVTRWRADDERITRLKNQPLAD